MLKVRCYESVKQKTDGAGIKAVVAQTLMSQIHGLSLFVGRGYVTERGGDSPCGNHGLGPTANVCPQALMCMIDKKTGEKSKTRPRFVKQDQVVIMRLESAGAICLEVFKKFPQLGRFTLRDEGESARSEHVRLRGDMPVDRELRCGVVFLADLLTTQWERRVGRKF